MRTFENWGIVNPEPTYEIRRCYGIADCLLTRHAHRLRKMFLAYCSSYFVPLKLRRPCCLSFNIHEGKTRKSTSNWLAKRKADMEARHVCGLRNKRAKEGAEKEVGGDGYERATYPEGDFQD
jgi:hypothetical protein